MLVALLVDDHPRDLLGEGLDDADAGNHVGQECAESGPAAPEIAIGAMQPLAEADGDEYDQRCGQQHIGS